MIRNYRRRLFEPIESMHDLTSSLTNTPAMKRKITASLGNQVADILGEAMRAGWQRVDGYAAAFEILEQAVQRINSERGVLTARWLVSDVLIPAQQRAMEGAELIAQLDDPDGGARVH